MHIFTTDSVEGMTIEKNFGTVFGTVIRSRNMIGRSLGNIASAFVTDRQYGATDVRRNGAISKCLKWGSRTVLRMGVFGSFRKGVFWGA